MSDKAKRIVKIGLIIAAIALVLWLAYTWLYAKPKPQPSEPEAPQPEPIQDPPQPAFVGTELPNGEPFSIFPLKPGKQGKEVEQLQMYLLKNKGGNVPITGVYDEQTDKLVREKLNRDNISKSYFLKAKMNEAVTNIFP